MKDIPEKITPEFIESIVDNVKYLHEGRLTIAIVTLKNGFVQVGESACAMAKTYDPKLGEKYAKEKALDALYHPLGFYILEKRSENPIFSK